VKLKIALIALLLLAVLVTAVPAMAKPTTLTVSYNQVQFQWRANKNAFGAWSVIYKTYPGHSDFRLTGNVLHSSVTYVPSPTDVQGDSNVYVYDNKEAKWILKEGTVQYTSLASGLPITEYFRGYVELDMSAMILVHGVLYQWGYVYLPQSDEATVKAKYKFAVWDDVMEAWLAGFSIYLKDPTVITYNTPFPSPFIEPVPASNYNPLGL